MQEKNYETDEIDEENKVEEIEIELGAKTQVIRPHVPIPNYTSYDDKMRLESADKSTYVDKSNIELAVTVSYEDSLRVETAKE